jgi:Transcriptional regulator PadR-like family
MISSLPPWPPTRRAKIPAENIVIDHIEKPSPKPLHGYGLAGRIKQTSSDPLQLDDDTLYPVLLKLEPLGQAARSALTANPTRSSRQQEFQ